MSTPMRRRPTMGGAIPEDTFPVRLAIVRALEGWNYDQAQRATGINSETWRLWEKGKRKCSDIESVSVQIANVTDWDRRWIQAGGPLADPTARKSTEQYGELPTLPYPRLELASSRANPDKSHGNRPLLVSVPTT